MVAFAKTFYHPPIAIPLTIYNSIMKQNYFFSLVYLCLLLTNQVTTGQSFSHQTGLPVNRTQSSSDYGNEVKGVNFISYSEKAGEQYNYPNIFSSMYERVDNDGLTSPDGWHTSYLDSGQDGPVTVKTPAINSLIAGVEDQFEVEAEDATRNKSEKTGITISGESTAAQAFSYKKDLHVNRTRSSSDFKRTVKFSDLFNYPDGYDNKAEIVNSSDIAISFSSTNESNLLFDGYHYSKWGGQYFYYKIPAGAYGTDTLTICIDYHGFKAKALVIANVSPLSVGNDSYTIDIGETLEMNVVKNDAPSSYLEITSLEVLQNTNFGTIINNSDGTLTYVNESSTPNYSFEKFEYRIADIEGNYDTATVNINIHKNSYASHVIEYMPAPGQFINESIGQSNSAEKTLGKQGGMISLGAFGGYVIYGFDQPIANNPQNPYGVDFSVKGNSFAASLYGAWTEPAAVRVMKDINGDGIPNDGEWFELAGSDYYMSTTQKNVKMTYYNPHYEERYTMEKRQWRNRSFTLQCISSASLLSQSF